MGGGGLVEGWVSKRAVSGLSTIITLTSVRASVSKYIVVNFCVPSLQFSVTFLASYSGLYLISISLDYLKGKILPLILCDFTSNTSVIES